MPLVSYTSFPTDPSSSILHPGFPFTLGITPSERMTTVQDPQKQEQLRLQEEPLSSTHQEAALQSLHPLPPYTALQGSLHQRALFRAASMYGYDLPSNSLPVYYPQV